MPKPLFLLLILLQLSFSVTLTTSITHPNDISSLKSLKSLIDPKTIPPSSCLSSWTFTSDPCTSPKTTHFICGLTCSQDSTRVITITLDSASYSGQLTPLVSQLSELVLLDLGQNFFHGFIPNSFSNLLKLESLSFRFNSFSGFIPNTILSLPNLKELDFSGNLLSGPIPSNFSNLTKLTRLDLSFNRFTGELPKLPPNLLELAIKSNSLSGSLTQLAFSESTRLETLELSSNSLTGAFPNWLLNLPMIQQINLSNNSLTRVEIWKPDKKQSHLIAVDLGYNKIEGNIPVNLSYYPFLASISMRYNRLRGPIPLQYSKKGSLRRLYLDGNYLSGIPPSGFFKNPDSKSRESGVSKVAGSFGDNCLRGCPRSSELCVPSQKPMSLCKRVYDGKKSLILINDR